MGRRDSCGTFCKAGGIGRWWTQKFLKLRLHVATTSVKSSRISKKMISKDIVREIVLSFIRESTIFLVDVKVGSANRIIVEVDKPDGITIDECASISRTVESGLDRETEDFELEVSSPGLTEPFKVMEQYRKNCGRQVNVLKQDGQNIKGLLQHVDDESISLDVVTKIRESGQKRRKTVMQVVTVNLNDIKTTKVIITL